MLQCFLERMLYGPRGLASVGVPIPLLGQHVILYGDLHTLLADGEGLAEAFQWKGAGGLRVCFRHGNCLMLNSDLATRVPGCVEIDCPNPALFKAVSSATLAKDVKAICAARKKVARGELGKTAAADYEKAAGLSVTPDGLLANDRLRDKAARAFTYDWVHCALSNGTLAVEINQLVASGVPQLSWASMEACFRLDWKFPKARMGNATQVWRVFAASRKCGDGDKVKASCSELLNVYSILRHYVAVAFGSEGAPAHLRDQIASFNACCDVVDWLLAAKRGRLAPGALAQGLQRKLQSHMQAHTLAYGTRLLIPKHHWLFDVAEHVIRDGMLVDMFITERMHLTCKSIAEKIKDTETFEASVLRMRAYSQRARLQKDGICDDAAKLLGNVRTLLEAGAATMSVAAAMVDSTGAQFSAGDIAVNHVTRCVGRLVSFMKAGGQVFVVVEMYVFQRRLSSHTTVWKAAEGVGHADESEVLLTWPATDVVQASAWYYTDAGRIVVVA